MAMAKTLLYKVFKSSVPNTYKFCVYNTIAELETDYVF